MKSIRHLIYDKQDRLSKTSPIKGAVFGELTKEFEIGKMIDLIQAMSKSKECPRLAQRAQKLIERLEVQNEIEIREITKK